MSVALQSLAMLTYLWSSHALRRLSGSADHQRLTLMVALAVLVQALAIGTEITSPAGWHLGLGPAISLFAWQCATLHLLLCLRWPLWHLGTWLWPLAAAAIGLTWVLPAGSPHSEALTPALRVHILLSLLAYASLTLAALQTLAYALLDKQLRRGEHRHNRPPLQLMEELVFRLVTMGFVLLLASIASGFLFVDDFFAQHLAHKAILSIIACALFGALIAGRLLRGWRGQTAIRWTFWAYGILLLAYFGSKIVLELILGRTWS